jgi:hypothetical protein
MKKNTEKMTHFSQKHAILFGISVLAFITITALWPQWCWVPLPFVCTYFVEMFGWLR